MTLQQAITLSESETTRMLDAPFQVYNLYSTLDDGVFGMNLACRTVADLKNDLVDQEVYLTVKGFPEVTCVNCKHSFLASRTPVL